MDTTVSLQTKWRRRSSAGMSLVQVIVTMGISVAIGVVVLQTLLQMNNVEHLMVLAAEAADREQDIRRLLISPAGCEATIEPLMPPGTKPISDSSFPFPRDQLKEIRDNNNGPAATNPQGVFKVGQRFARDRLLLKEMYLTNLDVNGNKVVLSNHKNDVVKIWLEIIFEKTNPQLALGGGSLRRRVPLVVKLDENGYVTTCTSLTETEVAKQICTDLSGQFTNGKCSLVNSPVIQKAICNTLGLGVSANGTMCQ